MPVLSGIYDSDYIQPVAKVKENLSIMTLGNYSHYIIEYLEPLPPGPASVADMVAIAGATGLAANATINKRIVPILQLNDLEFAHLRWEPLDNVEGVLWELSGQARFNSRNIHSRVDRNSRRYDPSLSLTTFWVLGLNRDMNLECRNPMGYAIPAARFQFFGYRYILKEIDLSGLSSDVKIKMKAGDIATVRASIGTTTWLPAEGRQS